MAPATTTTVKPNPSFGTLKWEHLFRNPPKDKSAFPALIAAVQPHVDSFNAATEEGGFLDLARKDIGIKSVFDGTSGNLGNKISRKCRPATFFHFFSSFFIHSFFSRLLEIN